MYADRFTRTAACRAGAPAIPLPKFEPALILKQARRLVSIGKRHGREFARALSLYSGMCATLRSNLRDLDRVEQGDATEQTKIGAVRSTRAEWSGVVSRPRPHLNDRVVIDGVPAQLAQAARGRRT